MSQGPRDPYDILGVRPGATDEEIHDAYARTAKRIHPDNFDRRRQPDLWRAANAALVELNEAYAALSGATRQASRGGPSQSDISASDIAEECLRRWRPNWGVPDSDYEVFLRGHLDVSSFVAGILAVMRNKDGLTRLDVLGESLAVLGQRSTELREAMALWYCDRTMAARNDAIRSFNEAVGSHPRTELHGLIEHLLRELQTATSHLEWAATLDPQGARLQEVRTLLETDLSGARDAKARLESPPSDVRTNLKTGRTVGPRARPVKRWRKRDWVWLSLIPLAFCLMIAFIVFQKPSKEDVLRKEFSGLLDAGRDGNQPLYDMALEKLVARRDTGFIAAAVSVGSGTEPGLRQAALAYLAKMAPRASIPQRLLITGFALQSLATGEEYAKSVARQCLDQVDPAWLQSCLQSTVLSASSPNEFRTAAARELLQRGGADAVAYVLDHSAEIGSAVNISTALGDIDPYDVVAGSRRTDLSRLPSSLLPSIVTAEQTLRNSRGASFTQVRVNGLDEGTAQIEIHNEAPVDLYLDLTPSRVGGGYSFMFPSQTTRKVAIRAGSYFYRADGRRSDITGTSGAREFEGSYSHIWVFFLEDQQAQMRAKYPDMQFR